MGRLWALSPQTIPRAAGGRRHKRHAGEPFHNPEVCQIFWYVPPPPGPFPSSWTIAFPPRQTDRPTASWQRKPELTPSLQLLVFPWAGRTSLLGNASWPGPTATQVTHSALLSDRVTLQKEPKKSSMWELTVESRQCPRKIMHKNLLHELIETLFEIVKMLLCFLSKIVG